MMGLPVTTWLFGALALLLSVLGLLFVLWPMLARRGASDSVLSRKETNITLYRERVAELQKAVALGEMSAEDARLQEEEAGRHLLEDAQAEPVINPEPKAGGQWLILVSMLFLPVFALLIYLQGDGWRLLEGDAKSPPWDFIIQRAETRLANNPQDEETLLFLARSYRALEKHVESAQVYARLNALVSPAKPELLVEEAEMLAMVKQGDMRGRPTELFEQALSIDADHGRALWYAGLAALQRQDETEAVTYWQALARQELPESFRQVLERQLRKLGVELPAGAVSAQAKPELPPVIRVKVSAAVDLVDKLPAETPVFVYARAEDGPARPLAARRLTLADLPTEVVLDDAMQMAGGPALSSLDRWEIVARVSLSGAAQANAGDPYGSLQLDKAGALTGKMLEIDRLWQK